MRFSALVPIIQCNDIEATKNWYETTLGFRCVGPLDQNWCRLERDGVALTFTRNAHLGPPVGAMP